MLQKIRHCTLALLMSLGLTSPAHAFDCQGNDLDERIARELLRFLECGGQVRGGQGSCLDQLKYLVVQTRVLAPQDESLQKFKLQDSDELEFLSVERDEEESDKDYFLEVRRVTFDVKRKNGRGFPKRFTFRFRVELPATQKSYGCGTLYTPPKSGGVRYIFIGKPGSI